MYLYLRVGQAGVTPYAVWSPEIRDITIDRLHPICQNCSLRLPASLIPFLGMMIVEPLYYNWCCETYCNVKLVPCLRLLQNPLVLVRYRRVSVSLCTLETSLFHTASCGGEVDLWSDFMMIDCYSRASNAAMKACLGEAFRCSYIL